MTSCKLPTTAKLACSIQLSAKTSAYACVNCIHAVQHTCYKFCSHHAGSKSHRKLPLLRQGGGLCTVFISWRNAFNAYTPRTSGQNRMLYSSTMCNMRGPVGPFCKTVSQGIVYHAVSCTARAIIYTCSKVVGESQPATVMYHVKSLFVLFTSELQKQSPAANVSKSEARTSQPSKLRI